MLNAKTVLVVCLLIFLSSAYLGQTLHAEAKSTANRAATAQKDASTANASLAELQEFLVADTDSYPLDKVTSHALLNLYNQRTTNGVNINQLTPGKLGVSVDTPVNELSEDVPGSTLKFVKVNVTGSYISYFGLLNYMKAMQSGTVVLTRLKVVDNTFEASLRVYGVNSSN